VASSSGANATPQELGRATSVLPSNCRLPTWKPRDEQSCGPSSEVLVCAGREETTVDSMPPLDAGRQAPGRQTEWIGVGTSGYRSRLLMALANHQSA